MEYSRNFYEILSNDRIFQKIVTSKDKVGYFSLPYQNISNIDKRSSEISQKNIVVIGIGGSSLGTKAIYNFLIDTKKFKRTLTFLDTIDPLNIDREIENINLNEAHYIVISKSGNTIEPISIFQYLSSRVNFTSHNCTVISEKNSSLHKFSVTKNLTFFEISSKVGGRFSVFSAVGLLPLRVIGVDISELLRGCKEVHESFFNKEFYYDHIINKARFLVENKSRFSINIIFSYSSIFQCFNKWFVQLWAESLGKKNINDTKQGLTPISLLGPEDQHSFLQLIMDGPRDKTVTFFKVDNLGIDTTIPANKDFDIFSLECISNRKFNDLINLQADATVQAILNQKDIPCDVISIPEVDEYNIATLMYRYQLLVSCIGAFLQIDPYNQPGVEEGKLILKEMLQNDK